MNYIVFGIMLFVGIHLVPLFPAVRGATVARLGEMPYKMVFSMLSIAGVALLFYGHSQAEIVPLWDGPSWAREATLVVMPVVFFLFATADMKTITRQKLRHPMSIGMLLWAAVHLMANGDLGSLLLFGGLAGYAALSIVSAEMRGHKKGDGTALIKNDISAIIGAYVIYAVVLYFHGFLFGESVI